MVGFAAEYIDGPARFFAIGSLIGKKRPRCNFLMPLDDFRRQVPDDARVDIDVLRACAERYNVSLIAAVLRWLGYTRKRAILVVSCDGYILWAR